MRPRFAPRGVHHGDDRPCALSKRTGQGLGQDHGGLDVQHPQVAPGLRHVVGAPHPRWGRRWTRCGPDRRVRRPRRRSARTAAARAATPSGVDRSAEITRPRHAGGFQPSLREGLGFLGGGPHVHEGSPSRFDQRGHGGCAQAAASSSDENGLRAHAPRWTLRT